MSLTVQVYGRVTPEGNLELPHLPIPEGRVHVTINMNDPLPEGFKRGLYIIETDEEAAQRRAAMDAAFGCLSDEDARIMLAAVVDCRQIEPELWK